jgi:hypothetical protein
VTETRGDEAKRHIHCTYVLEREVGSLVCKQGVGKICIAAGVEFVAFLVSSVISDARSGDGKNKKIPMVLKSTIAQLDRNYGQLAQYVSLSDV